MFHSGLVVSVVYPTHIGCPIISLTSCLWNASKFFYNSHSCFSKASDVWFLIYTNLPNDFYLQFYWSFPALCVYPYIVKTVLRWTTFPICRIYRKLPFRFSILSFISFITFLCIRMKILDLGYWDNLQNPLDVLLNQPKYHYSMLRGVLS